MLDRIDFRFGCKQGWYFHIVDVNFNQSRLFFKADNTAMVPKIKHEQAIYQARLSAKETPSHKPAKTDFCFKQ